MTREDGMILASWSEVLESGVFVQGEQLEAFENELAGYVGVKHCVGVSSGTDALALILKATIEPGDEVLVPALTFIGTAEAVIHAGGVPVFTDVDPDTWCMTAETAEQHVTTSTAAVIPVHLFGNPAPIDDLATLELPLIEDACQAAGTRYRNQRAGALGNAAAFSFYPSKNLPGCGDGGAVTTDDANLASQVRRLRHHGAADDGLHVEVGGTHRLDELQAAALRVRLSQLEVRVAFQRRCRYGFESGAGHVFQVETPGGESSWHRIVDAFGFRPGHRRYYHPPLHLQPAMKPYWRTDLPVAEMIGEANRDLTPW